MTINFEQDKAQSYEVEKKLTDIILSTNKHEDLERLRLKLLSLHKETYNYGLYSFDTLKTDLINRLRNKNSLDLQEKTIIRNLSAVLPDNNIVKVASYNRPSLIQ